MLILYRWGLNRTRFISLMGHLAAVSQPFSIIFCVNLKNIPCHLRGCGMRWYGGYRQSHPLRIVIQLIRLPTGSVCCLTKIPKMGQAKNCNPKLKVSRVQVPILMFPAPVMTIQFLLSLASQGGCFLMIFLKMKNSNGNFLQIKNMNGYSTINHARSAAQSSAP